MDLYGISVALIVELTGTHPDTARRWKRTGRVPAALARFLELRLTGELGLVDGAWRGWHLQRGELWTSHGWRVAPGEILAMPFRYQQIRALEARVTELTQSSALIGSPLRGGAAPRTARSTGA